MSDVLLNEEKIKRRLPLAAILFFGFYALFSLVVAIMDGIPVLADIISLAAGQTDAVYQLLQTFEDFLDVTRGVAIFLGAILVMASLIRRKCGKMMIMGALTMSFYSLVVDALAVVKTIYFHLAAGRPYVDLIYECADTLATAFEGNLPLIVFTVFVIVASLKKAQNGMKKIWFLPVVIVIVLMWIGSIGYLEGILNEGLRSGIIWMIVELLEAIVSFFLKDVLFMLAVLFFGLWVRNPYKKKKRKADKEEQAEPAKAVAEQPMLADAPAAPAPVAPAPVAPTPVAPAPAAPAPVAPAPVAPTPVAPAPVAPAPVAPVTDQLDDEAALQVAKLHRTLTELKVLYDEGLITEAEYAEKRRQLLGL